MGFGTFGIGTKSYGEGSGGSDIVYYAVSLVTPLDGGYETDTTPNFTVLPDSSDGSTMTIEWQWDNSYNFDNVSGFRQIKTTSGEADEVNATTTPDTALGTFSWYWRVRAGDGASNWSSYTTARSLSIFPISTTSSFHMYENVGLDPATMEDTEDAHIHIYENIGVEAAAQENSEDAHHHIYENVQTRPAGSSEKLPPTHN